MTREEWLAAFAAAAGVDPPTAAEAEALLGLAATAAHASERPAAPLTCWVAGRSRLSLDELSALAERLAAEGEDRPPGAIPGP